MRSFHLLLRMAYSLTSGDVAARVGLHGKRLPNGEANPLGEETRWSMPGGWLMRTVSTQL